jgi:hypothetical protein
VTRLQAGLPITVQFSAEAKDLSLFHSIQTGTGAHSASYSIVSRALSPGINQVELKIGVAIPKLPPHTFTVQLKLYLYHMIPLKTLTSKLKMENEGYRHM